MMSAEKPTLREIAARRWGVHRSYQEFKRDAKAHGETTDWEQFANCGGFDGWIDWRYQLTSWLQHGLGWTSWSSPVGWPWVAWLRRHTRHGRAYGFGDRTFDFLGWCVDWQSRRDDRRHDEQAAAEAWSVRNWLHDFRHCGRHEIEYQERFGRVVCLTCIPGDEWEALEARDAQEEEDRLQAMIRHSQSAGDAREEVERALHADGWELVDE